MMIILKKIRKINMKYEKNKNPFRQKK